MKAIDFKNFGEAEVLELMEIPEPILRSHDLLVRTRAVGVNRADLIMRRGGFGRPDYGDSKIMGLELSGDVIAVGPEVRDFKVGDRIMGIVGGGAYAEIARMDSRMAMLIPEGLDYIQAAAIPEVFVTAHEALFHLGHVVKESSVLIHAAAGGVGSAAVQLAHAEGAKVFATAGASKLERVRELGADVTIDSQSEDFEEVIARLIQGRGVEVIVDFIGGPYFEKNLRSLAEGGRLIQVGLLGGKSATISLDRVLYQRLQIIGTVMKSRTPSEKQAMVTRFRNRWLAHFRQGELMPIVDRVYPLANAADAHRRMESRANVGKIILTLDSDGFSGTAR